MHINRLFTCSRFKTFQKHEYPNGPVLYDPLSRNTHQINDLTYLILQALHHQPLSAVTLCPLLNQSLEYADVQTNENDASVLLKQLEEVGLIERLHAPNHLS